MIVLIDFVISIRFCFNQISRDITIIIMAFKPPTIIVINDCSTNCAKIASVFIDFLSSKQL